jgi:hypothetical protein
MNFQNDLGFKDVEHGKLCKLGSGQEAHMKYLLATSSDSWHCSRKTFKIHSRMEMCKPFQTKDN